MTQTYLRYYCTCGAAFKVNCPEDAAPLLLRIFREGHMGEGHDECDAASSARARRKADAQPEGARQEVMEL